MVLLLLALSVAWVLQGRLREARRQLETVAAMEEHHIEEWLGERWASAGLSGTSFPQAELYQAWRAEGHEDARDRLFLRLRQFAEAGGFANVALLDQSLDLVWSAEPLTVDPSAVARAHWPAGAEPGSQAFLEPDWLGPSDPMMGVAVALPTEGSEAAPVVVYLLTADDMLTRALRAWAGTNPPMRVIVFRASAAGLEGLADTSSAVSGAFEPWSMPWSHDTAPAVRLARGELEPGASAVGPDDRGVPVLAAGGTVGALGWYFLVERERAGVWATVMPTVALAAVIAALAFVTVVAGLARLRDRQALLAERAASAARAERSEALALLQAVSDASPDAIFAKDLEGRYTLVNSAAAAFAGLAPDEMIGRDDSGIVSAEEFEQVREHERRVAREGRVMTFEETVSLPLGQRTFEASKGPLRDESGSVFGLYGISRDVTEARRVQRTNEEQARALARQVEELERFNGAFVDREIAMIELKRQVNDAMRALGRPEPYDLGDIDAEGDQGA
ncbi:MAG: PAS domain S-box protein [Trueperaceae bacterium]|nr:MAG: PAS domain S-box protein [Trueperaceae bacterium]